MGKMQRIIKRLAYTILFMFVPSASTGRERAEAAPLWSAFIIVGLVLAALVLAGIAFWG